MSNYCDMSIHAAGKEADIEKFLAAFDDDNIPHLARVTDHMLVQKTRNKDLVHVIVVGGCAWSMVSSINDEYRENENAGVITTLRTLAKDLSLEIEAYSYEPGMEFSEHLHYVNDVVIADEVCDYAEYYYDEDEFESFEDFCAQYGLDIKESDLDANYYHQGGFDEVYFDDVTNVFTPPIYVEV